MVKINDESLRKIEKMLNNTISSLLYGGSSDPSWSELEGAASCFKTLQLLELKVEKEKGTRETLEKDNVHYYNFLK
jgi:hypothetical protein